jgi:hypothetical protein
VILAPRLPGSIAGGPRKRLAGLGIAPLYTEPGSASENGYCESFNAKRSMSA